MNKRIKVTLHCNHWFTGLVFSLSCFFVSNASASDVSVSVGGEIIPGVYGRIDIGSRPPPPVIYAQPIVIAAPARQTAVIQPVYMHVPPGHAKKWAKHCHKYSACGQPVYFVKNPNQDNRQDNRKHQGKGKHKHHKNDD